MKTQDADLRDDVFIVAFTKDWGDVPTCTTHILREMAKTIPVLWVCSIGTRKPQVGSLKDWRRLLCRMASGLQRAVLQENRLRVLRPLLVPKAEWRLCRWLNRLLFRFYLWREIPHAFKGTLEYWCFVPNAVDLLPYDDSGRFAATTRGPTCRIIYYCADDWTKFHNLDGDWMSAKESRLIDRADVVFATSRYLVDKFNAIIKGASSPPIVYMPHGVDYAAFAKALDRHLPLPVDLAGIARPIVGFYGNLHAWVDFTLIARLAKARPGWSFVLIGEAYEDLCALRILGNVHLLGRREHAILPDYCRGFQAAIIPYDLSHARMESVNPVKAKELLAAGVPVVASPLPELAPYGDAVMLCESDEAWLAALEHQLQIPLEARALISQRVAGEDWERKVADIRRVVEAV